MTFLNNLIKTAIVDHLNIIILIFFLIVGTYATYVLFGRSKQGFVSKEDKTKY